MGGFVPMSDINSKILYFVLDKKHIMIIRVF